MKHLLAPLAGAAFLATIAWSAIAPTVHAITSALA